MTTMDLRTFATRFADSLDRMVNSAKLKTAVGAAVAAYFAARNVAPSLPPEQRVYLWIAFMFAAMGAVSIAIHGWTLEDVANKQTAPPAAAAPAPVNLAVGDHATASVQSPAAPAAPVTSTLPTPMPTKGDPVKTAKPPGMIQLSILLFASLLLFAGGCVQDPAYTTFRENLAPLDESLYQQHEQLMTEAVQAGIRTPTAQQALAFEIKAARDLYAASRKNTPSTTQPTGQ